MDVDRDLRGKVIDHKLEQLAAGKVVDGDPAELEARLLREQDVLEWEAGEDYFATASGVESRHQFFSQC